MPKTAVTMHGAMRTRQIVQAAVDFGWILLAFPQIALHVGKSAQLTLTAAAPLMFALEPNFISNVKHQVVREELIKSVLPHPHHVFL
jgi:hypothetical protein